MNGIFISYRRQDAPGHAGRLYDRLRERFGRDRVFMDVAGNIEPGLAFDEVIEEAVGSCEALLVVIGDEWLTSADEGGRRRLDDPADYLRLETTTALARNIRVVPVLVARAQMPSSEDLPYDMKPLAKRQAIELSDQRWDFDVDRLIAVLEKVLDEEPVAPTPKPASGGAPEPPPQLPVDPGQAVDPEPGTPVPTISERWARLSKPVRFAAMGAVGLLAAWGAYAVIPGGEAESIVVPEVTGMSFVNAAAALETVGLIVGDTASEPSDSVAAGAVLRQAPTAGDQVESGAPVKLMISAGSPSGEVATNPGPSPPPSPPPGGGDPAAGADATGEETLPDFMGQRALDASRRIRDLGLTLKLEYITTAATPSEQVYRQSPAAGTPIDEVGVVRLTASETHARGERETGFRHLGLGEPISFDPPPTGGDRRAVTMILREGPYDFEGKPIEGLHLAPGPGVQVAPFLGQRSDPTETGCLASVRQASISAVPIDDGMRGDVFCVSTRAGSVGAVMIRLILDPPDQDGDRVLARYWIWE